MRVRVSAQTGVMTETPDSPLLRKPHCLDKNIPYHLRHADLTAHRDQLTSRRTVLTHMSPDMLEHLDEACFETASDGLVLHI